ncbi:hypothetical protein EMIT0158MI4_40571 [Burkholderia ambifaria]
MRHPKTEPTAKVITPYCDIQRFLRIKAHLAMINPPSSGQPPNQIWTVDFHYCHNPR